MQDVGEDYPGRVEIDESDDERTDCSRNDVIVLADTPVTAAAPESTDEPIRLPDVERTDEATNMQDHTYTRPVAPVTTSSRGRRLCPPKWTKDYAMGPQASTATTPHATTRMPDPTTLAEAYRSPSSVLWKAVVKEEYDNLISNEVWRFKLRRPGMRSMRTKWALKTKFYENGQISRYRARLVALGNSQRPGIDYNLTYSPVVKSRTLQILFPASVELGWEVHHVDIKASYLAADLPDEAFLEIPDGLAEMREYMKDMPSDHELQSGKLVLCLPKCMYGLHQSGRIWNERLDAYLLR